MSFKVAAKVGCSKDGGMVGLEVGLAYRRLLENEGVPSRKTTETGSRGTKDGRWIAKRTEVVPEQNTGQRRFC